MRDAGVHASGLTRLYKLNEVMATPSYIITYIHGVHYLEINVKLDTFQGTSPRLNKKMSGLVDWVSDSLHDILGLSDTYTAEFLVGLAKKRSSSEAFLKKLKDTGAVTMNDRMSSFASELWMKTPHQRVDRYQASRDKEKAAIVQRQKNKSYRLLSDDEEEPEKSTRVRKSQKQRKEREPAQREQGQGRGGISGQRRRQRCGRVIARGSKNEGPSGAKLLTLTQMSGIGEAVIEYCSCTVYVIGLYKGNLGSVMY